MPREVVTVQIGQCGNQIGSRFWDLALREHAIHNPAALYDEPLSSFFVNVDPRSSRVLAMGDGSVAIGSLRARAVRGSLEEFTCLAVMLKLSRARSASDVRRGTRASTGVEFTLRREHEVGKALLLGDTRRAVADVYD